MDGTPTTKERAITAIARDRDLTDEHIQSKVADVAFFIPDGYGGTLCMVTLVNGHIVRGESSCPNDENAQALAYTDALNKLWELERYLAAEGRYQVKQQVEPPGFRVEIGEFRDGVLALSCGPDGMASDLVFEVGYERGDPRLAKQRAILEWITHKVNTGTLS